MSTEPIRVTKPDLHFKGNIPYIRATVNFDITATAYDAIMKFAMAQVYPERELQPRRWQRLSHEQETVEDKQAREFHIELAEELPKLKELFSKFTSQDVQDYIASQPDLQWSMKRIMRHFFEGRTIKTTEPTKKLFRAFEGRVRVAVKKIETERGQKFISKRVPDGEKFDKVHFIPLYQSNLSEVRGPDGVTIRIKPRPLNNTNE